MSMGKTHKSPMQDISLQRTVIVFVDDIGFNINWEDCEEKTNQMTGARAKQNEEAGGRTQSLKTRLQCWSQDTKRGNPEIGSVVSKTR